MHQKKLLFIFSALIFFSGCTVVGVAGTVVSTAVNVALYPVTATVGAVIDTVTDEDEEEEGEEEEEIMKGEDD